ncbi:MAG TPA: hypothetical protein VFL91_01295, partial [Thermomicrobiales bacterium]|nr:hypothetical protein [Thermomicrobiales bacterium]
MQSEQEELAKLFCEMAMGMPFVFVPDKYDKGSARREPADLVWACNGCLVLIYLSRMKRASKARQHNARQIKGWIRAWRSLGQVLRGRNQYGPIAIHAGDTRYPHVVILSIIECSDATAEYHYAETQALGVTMFATVPLSAIAHLSHMHASMLDVFHVLDWLRVRHTAAITETEIH